MVDFDKFSDGYGLSFMSLILVTAYFVATTLMVRRRGSASVSVPRYEPPAGASPAVAAWLSEHNLSRAIAAAFVNMAAKGYLEIAHSQASHNPFQRGSSPPWAPCLPWPTLISGKSWT